MTSPVHDETWRDRAACRRVDPRLFDPLDGRETHALGTEAEAHPRIRSAIAVCLHCPVMLECGLAAGMEEGVWAGVYRSKMKAERQRARKQAVA